MPLFHFLTFNTANKLCGLFKGTLFKKNFVNYRSPLKSGMLNDSVYFVKSLFRVTAR